MLNKNNLSTFYIVIQLVGIFFAVQPTALIDSSIKMNTALVLHLSALVFFILGSLLPALNISNSKKINNGDYVIIKPSFYYYCMLLTVFGLIISFAQIRSFMSISEYFSLSLSNDESLSSFREESGSGGLSGVLKMFSYAPLTIYLLCESVIKFYKTDEGTAAKLNKLKYVVLFITLIKALIWLDRLTLLAIIITNVYLFINKNNRKYIIYFLPFAAVGIFIGNYMSERRLAGYSLFDFVILYTKLGLVNFELIIKNVHNYTFGLNTFLGPLNFIFRYFGHEIPMNNNYDFIWNPAQYMNSYLYQDFGVFSLIVYMLIGWFVKNIDYWKVRYNKYYIVVFFTCLFSMTTFWSVPIIRAIEFWLMIIIQIFSLKYITFQKYTDK